MKSVKVGRAQGNDVVIKDDYSVSRFHCEFILDDLGDYWVVDLNSTNGTYINEVRHSGKTKLNRSDRVRIGHTNLPWQDYFTNVDENSTTGDPDKKQITLSDAAKQLGIEVDEAVGILERYANLSNLNEDSKISNWHYSVLEGIIRTKAEEKKILISELEGLPKDSDLFPPRENAMCYCQAPPSGWHGFDDDKGDEGEKGNGLIRRVLIIVAIALAIAIVIAVAFV